MPHYKLAIQYKTAEVFTEFLKTLETDVCPLGEAGGLRSEVHVQGTFVTLTDGEDETVLQHKLFEAARNLARKLNKLKGPLEFYLPDVGTDLAGATNTIQSNSVCIAHTITYHGAVGDAGWPTLKEGTKRGFTSHGLHVRFRSSYATKTLDERLEQTTKRYSTIKGGNELVS